MKKLSKKGLEILLQKCESFKDPKAYLEQYTIPADIAANLLYLAYLKGDIEDKVVYDLGCGTGRLGIGCALLGAREVWGFDVDNGALKIARKNSSDIGVDVKWKEMDITDVKGDCYTVVQNPPFGAQKIKADRVFLQKALEVGKVIYSMHKAETREFIKRYVQKLNGNIVEIMTVDFILPYTYEFHRKRAVKTKVDIYRILSMS